MPQTKLFDAEDAAAVAFFGQAEQRLISFVAISVSIGGISRP
jgi:hypothetical protein